MRSTADLVEGNSLPCVVIVQGANHLGDVGIEQNFKLRNLGAGPALNVSWKFEKGATRLANSLAPDEEVPIGVGAKDFINNGNRITCQFQSLSQTRYVSETKLIGDASIHTFHLEHEFRKLTN